MSNSYKTNTCKFDCVKLYSLWIFPNSKIPAEHAKFMKWLASMYLIK